MTTTKKSPTVKKATTRKTIAKKADVKKIVAKVEPKETENSELVKQFKELQKMFKEVQEQNIKITQDYNNLKTARVNIEQIEERIFKINELKTQKGVFEVFLNDLDNILIPDNLTEFEDTHLRITFAEVNGDSLLSFSNKHIIEKFIEFIKKEIENKVSVLDDTIHTLSNF